MLWSSAGKRCPLCYQEIPAIDPLDDFCDWIHASPHHIMPQHGFFGHQDTASNAQTQDVDGAESGPPNRPSKTMVVYPKTGCSGTCLQCNGYFQRLDRHMLTHSGERPFACKLCPERFRQRIHLTRHTERHERVTNHPCPYCGKVLTRNDKLKNHMKKTCKVLREY